MAEISSIVPTTINYGTSRGVPRRVYASPILVTSGEKSATDDEIVVDIQPTGRGKVTRIVTQANAQAIFQEGSTALAEAQNYFQMRPVPRGPLYVGRWNKTAKPSFLRGVAASVGTIADILAITNGAFTFNGIDYPGTGSAIDLSSGTNEDGVAVLLSTLINADASVDGIVVSWDAIRKIFIITGGTASGDTVITEGFTNTGTGATGDTTALGLDNGFLMQEAVVETLAQAMRSMRQVNSQFQTILADELVSTYDNLNAISTWAAAESDVLTPLFEISDRATLAGTDTSDGVRLSQTQREMALVWRGTRDGAMTKLAAFYGSLRLNAGDAVRTPKGLALTGSVADDLTADQEETLRGLRINMYVPLGETLNIFQEGHCVRPQVWLDTRIWLGWFVNAIQSTISRLLLNGQIAIDAVGAATLKSALERVCQEGVRNRGISPGRVSEEISADIAAFTGAGTFDGNLVTGYIVEVSDPNLIPTALRANRTGPATRIWVNGSGRVHNLPITINVIE